MGFVVKFRDGEIVHTYRNDDGNGSDMVFPTIEKATEFFNTLDPREFPRWIEEVK